MATKKQTANDKKAIKQLGKCKNCDSWDKQICADTGIQVYLAGRTDKENAYMRELEALDKREDLEPARFLLRTPADFGCVKLRKKA